MRHVNRFLVAAAAFTCIVMPVSAQTTVPEAADEATPPEGAAENGGDEIVVTARRRAENLLDVPISITALSGDALDRAGLYSIQDLQDRAPSLRISMSNPRQTSVAIRGLGNNPASDGLETSVGLYLDGVYLGRPGMVAFDMIDIEQMEILRGPQGTLFGKNTTAGALNITTRRPTFSPEFTFEASAGTLEYRQFRGSISGPIVDDRLAARLSFYDTRREGHITNIATGGRLNGTGRRGIRGQLLFTPTENLDIRIIGEYNEESAPGAATVFANQGPVPAGTVDFLTRVQQLGGTPISTIGRQVNLDSRQYIEVDQGAASIELNWEIGDHDLTSLTAYRYWNFYPLNDGDQANIDAIRAQGADVEDDQFSQEIRLASPSGGSFDYVVGLYYFRQNLYSDLKLVYGALADPWLGTAPGTNNGKTQRTLADLTTDSYAAFGQGTLHIGDAFHVTAGLRYTHERKTADITRLATVPTDGPDGAVVRQIDLRTRDDSVSGLLSLSYDFSDDVMGYVTASHGSKAGGINPTIPGGTAPVESLIIDPERALSFEAGVKASILDRRVRLSASVFNTVVRDYQTTFYDAATRFTTLTNGGKIRTRGVELEADIRPVDGLNINLSGSYNQTNYLRYTAAPCSAEFAALPTSPTPCSQDLSGQPVVGAPRWILSSSVYYSTKVGRGHEIFGLGELSYRSRQFGSIDNSRFGVIDGYVLANLRAGIRTEDQRYELALWVRNLTNQYYSTTMLALGRGLYNAYLGDKRSAGVTFRFTY